MVETETIDTTVAEQAINREKVSELESELSKYKEEEAKRLEAEEMAKKDAMDQRLAALEAEKEEMKKSFDEKLEAVNLRASSASKPNTSTEKLTKEEYMKNRAHYDTLALKAGKNMDGVFNS